MAVDIETTPVNPELPAADEPLAEPAPTPSVDDSGGAAPAPVNWQQEAEQLRRERDTWNQEREELRQVASDEYETRLRLEGHLRAAGQRDRVEPAAAPSAAPATEQQQLQEALEGQYRWGQQNLVPLVGSATAETKQAFVDALVADNGPDGAWDVMETFFTNKILGLMAANNLNTLHLIQSHAQNTANNLIDDHTARAASGALVNQVFNEMYKETAPHIGAFYTALNPRGGQANALQVAFTKTACAIADDIARQMMNNGNVDRAHFLHLLKQQGRADIQQDYLRRVAGALEQAFSINKLPPPAPAPPPPPARATPPPPGITPAGRGESRIDIGTASEIDEDPVAAIIADRMRM